MFLWTQDVLGLMVGWAAEEVVGWAAEEVAGGAQGTSCGSMDGGRRGGSGAANVQNLTGLQMFLHVRSSYDGFVTNGTMEM